MVNHLEMGDTTYLFEEDIQLYNTTNDIEEFISLEKELENNKNEIKTVTSDIDICADRMAKLANCVFYGILVAGLWGIFGVEMFFKFDINFFITLGAVFATPVLATEIGAIVDILGNKSLNKKRAMLESLKSTQPVIEERIKTLKKEKGSSFVKAVEDKKEKDIKKSITLNKIKRRQDVNQELVLLADNKKVQRYIELASELVELDKELKESQGVTKIVNNPIFGNGNEVIEDATYREVVNTTLEEEKQEIEEYESIIPVQPTLIPVPERSNNKEKTLIK